MKKILFVDDDPRILDGFKRMLKLKASEWECRFALSVEQAWSLAQEDLPDAIVSDLNMPVQNGIDLLRMVRDDARTQYTPFILLTGNNDIKMRMDCLGAGASDFLNKPCDFAELAARLKNALTLKEYQDQVKLQNEVLEQRVAERTKELAASRREVVFRLALASELRDSATGHHIFRVGLLSQLLAAEIGFDEQFQEEMFLASTLHDVGKLGIPDTILLKPGRLTTEEFDKIKEHCQIGADTLRFDISSSLEHVDECETGSNSLLELAATIALTHHEWWDGSGYPRGTAGEDIPIVGRIVAVADVFDALCSTRPYKDAMPHEDAILTIQGEVGTHFDPRIVAALTTRKPEAIAIMERYAEPDFGKFSAAA